MRNACILGARIVAHQWYEPLYVDLWSMGVLLCTLVCGTVHFKASSMNELHKVILNNKLHFPDGLSAEVQDLILQMLHPVSHLRISLERMAKHAWFKEEELAHGLNRLVGTELYREYA